MNELPDANELLDDFEITYIVMPDGRLVESINGQVHSPVDPIEVIRRLQARIAELEGIIEDWKNTTVMLNPEMKQRLSNLDKGKQV